MNIEKIDSKDIKEYLNKEKYAELMLLQLQKDMSSVGEDFDILEAEQGADRYNQIESSLSNRLAHFIQTDPEKLMALLYRIDIPEKTVRRHLESDELAGTIQDRLVYLILKRELMKVLYREHYSGR